MEPIFDIELQDCPYCGGVGCFEDEGGWCLYVQCLDCGSHTAEFPYKNPEERAEMARQAARTWAFGKIINPNPGE